MSDNDKKDGKNKQVEGKTRQTDRKKTHMKEQEVTEIQTMERTHTHKKRKHL